MRIIKNHPLLKLINSYIIDSPQPSNLSYMWNFGSLLGFSLIIQIITGVTLAMHYEANILEAFNSVEHIMRDVNNGWLVRYLHSNTASAFFFIVYLHMARGLYYGSYKTPRTLVWTVGTVIFILMIATAFLGYVLPYGQMSLWGATVITNLMSAIPWVGQDIVQFIWGGFSVNNATLNRFFALHFVLPFILAGLVIMHLISLHERAGSGNPLGISPNVDRIPFAPYFIFKDLITIFLFILVLSIFVFYMPNTLGDSENYVMANPMQTPSAIVPEWYLLPFYAVLRSIPNKLLGVIAMFSAILMLLVMFFTDLSKSRGIQFKPLSKVMFFVFVANFLALVVLGAKHVESPFIEFGQISTILYFAYFLIIVPFVGLTENSISEFWFNFNKKSQDHENNKDIIATYALVNSFLVSPIVLGLGCPRPRPRTQHKERISEKQTLELARKLEGLKSGSSRLDGPTYSEGNIIDSDARGWSSQEEQSEGLISDYEDPNQLSDCDAEMTRINERYHKQNAERKAKKRSSNSDEGHEEERSKKRRKNRDDRDDGDDGQGKSGGGGGIGFGGGYANTNASSAAPVSSNRNAIVNISNTNIVLYIATCSILLLLTSVYGDIIIDTWKNIPTSFSPSLCFSFLMDKSFPIALCDAPEPWGFYFQDSGTPQMEALVELHDNIMFYLIIILFGVGWTLISIVNVYNSGRSPLSHKYLSHGASIELIWTITPAVILILIAFPSFKLLYLMDEVSDPAMVVVAEGHQWYWSYQYADFLDYDEEFVEFDSYLVPESDLKQGALRMLEVDNRLIIPELTHIRFIVGGADVIHSFACPSLGIKCDAYPGRLNQASVMINRAATFYGQCSEICGILHSSMPIVVESVSIEKFVSWLLQQ